MPLIDVSTSRVIKEVELRPVLWNTSHELYRNKHARKRAWNEVFCELIPDFKTLSGAKQKDTDRAIQQRWKTARDAYMRCKARLKTEKHITRYFYYDHMAFLDKLESEDSSKQPKEQSAAEDSNDPLEATTSSPPCTLKQENIDFDVQDSQQQEDENEPDLYSNEDGDNDCSSESEEEIIQNQLNEQNSFKTVVQRPLKRKIEEFNKEMVKMFKDHSIQMKNDNMSFFMSMLPIVNKFTDQQKLMFRSEVIRVAMDISSQKKDEFDVRILR